MEAIIRMFAPVFIRRASCVQQEGAESEHDCELAGSTYMFWEANAGKSKSWSGNCPGGRSSDDHSN